MVTEFRPKSHGGRPENFTAQHLHCIAADANINYSVISSRGANENSARTAHLEALFDHHALIWLRDMMGDHPGGGAACRRAGCRIFSVVEDHPRVELGVGLLDFAADKVKEFAP